MKPQITRIFHPIGQGAFYSEEHINARGKSLNIVYDCGSITIKGQKMKRRIKGAFYTNTVIDILFISHLHADHINGIDYLKDHFDIRNVVMPLLSDEAKIIYKINNYFQYNQLPTGIIDDPQTYFGERTNVIFVEEAGPLNDIPREEQLGPLIDIEKKIRLDDEVQESQADSFNGQGTGQRKTIASGTPIGGIIDEINWGFVPYNYRQEERVNQFLIFLYRKGLELKDIDTIEKIIAHKSEIRYAYDKLDGDLNKNSMLLYSGPLRLQTGGREFCFQARCNTLHGSYSRYWDGEHNHMGCLYLGDIDLNEPGILNDIRYNLGYYLKAGITLQLAHHGALKNFNREILETDWFHIIVCYGTTNQFGHPADRVVAVSAMENSLHAVTEIPDSIAIQTIRIDK